LLYKFNLLFNNIDNSFTFVGLKLNFIFMIKRIFRRILKLCLWFLVISVALVVVYRFIPVPYTPLMFVRLFDQKANGNEMILSHDWVPLEDISINM